MVLGTETILVVEDQADLLGLVKTSLEQYGYEVLTASDPIGALFQCKSYSGEIHLLLTDVIMPLMNGRELSENIKGSKPGIKTLFMSGHSGDKLGRQGILEKGIELVEKPFTPYELAKRVRELLDS